MSADLLPKETTHKQCTFSCSGYGSPTFSQSERDQASKTSAKALYGKAHWLCVCDKATVMNSLLSLVEGVYSREYLKPLSFAW